MKRKFKKIEKRAQRTVIERMIENIDVKEFARELEKVLIRRTFPGEGGINTQPIGDVHPLGFTEKQIQIMLWKSKAYEEIFQELPFTNDDIKSLNASDESKELAPIKAWSRRFREALFRLRSQGKLSYETLNGEFYWSVPKASLDSKETKPTSASSADSEKQQRIWNKLPIGTEKASKEEQEATFSNEGKGALMSATDIGEKYGIPVEKLRKRLERFRKKNFSGNLWMENSNREARKPKYLYKVSASEIQSIIHALKRP